MTVGIIAAFGKETKLLRLRFEESDRLILKHQVIFLHSYKDHNVFVMRSGQGQENGRIGTLAMLDTYRPDCVINTGVAGAISPHCTIGDVIVAKRILEYDKQPDSDVESHIHHADPDLLESVLACGSDLDLKEAIHQGTVLSGQSVIDSQPEKKRLWDRFQGLCVEQEGAAIAMTCLERGVPWIAIRSISDMADGNVTSEFKDNIDRACENISEVILRFIETIDRK